MKSEKEDFQELKEWLRRYRYAVEDIRALQMRISVLRDRMLSPSSPILSDMPKGESRDNDRIGTAYSIVDELEQEAEEEQQRARIIYKEIYTAARQIRGTKTAEIRLVLQLRYLDLLQWDEIAFTIFGDESDFYDRESTYTRKCHAYHRQGLELLENIIEL